MSEWTPYLRTKFPQPTDADRARLERLAGAALPDAYWRMVGLHQGEVLDTELELDGEGAINFGVLLLAVSPQVVEKRNSSYCIEDCLDSMEDRYAAGLLPFADDTGGNYWAFDFRTHATDPAVVFIDHELSGDDGVTPAADSFAAFMTMAAAPGF
jgi:hypothetical protein